MSPAGPTLLCVPNVSEGRDPEAIAAIGLALAPAGGPVRLLDVHSDPDHHRSVFSLAGPGRALAQALIAGAARIFELVDLRRGRRGLHPHVGALDVAPFVYLDRADRGAACAEALVAADEIARGFDVPTFLYGELSRGRTRAEIRRGGLESLNARIAAGELAPDFGPRAPDPAGGVTLVAAREPLVAFNLELAPPATAQDARTIAGLIREGGPEGLPGVRAIGLGLSSRGGEEGQRGGEEGEVAQVSMNVEDPLEVPLARIVAAVSGHAHVAGAEIVGLAPRKALEGMPVGLPMRGFDPARQVIENALGL